ncbi:MAG: EamA family transporter [Planctomycetes bacterium]|nr:EamA family transporter [Planctomycetota bacterium]
MTSSLPTPSRTATSFALVALCLIWGSSWLVIADGLQSLPPLTSVAVRMVIAAAVMAIATPFLRRFERGDAPPTWLTLVVGSIQLGYSYAIVYLSETVLPSGLASLLWTVFPIFMAIGAHLYVPGESLRPAQWFGFLVGFVGVGVLFVKVLGDIDERAIPMGLLLLSSPLASTVSNILVKRNAAKTSSVLLNRNALCVGALVLSVAALAFERDTPADWTPRAIASVAYLAVFATAVAFGLYFWLLRVIPAHRMSLISYVNPAIALFLGWAVGKEPVTAWTIAGSALILLGVYLVVRGHAPAPAACDPEP